jgi:hypothetical protein
MFLRILVAARHDNVDATKLTIAMLESINTLDLPPESLLLYLKHAAQWAISGDSMQGGKSHFQVVYCWLSVDIKGCAVGPMRAVRYDDDGDDDESFYCGGTHRSASWSAPSKLSITMMVKMMTVLIKLLLSCLSRVSRSYPAACGETGHERCQGAVRSPNPAPLSCLHTAQMLPKAYIFATTSPGIAQARVFRRRVQEFAGRPAGQHKRRILPRSRHRGSLPRE